LPSRAVATIDTAALAANVRRLRRATGDRVRLCAVVKANGYGHGAVTAARAAGADWLAVATADEAAELRAAGIDQRILVMGALSDAELDVALGADADVGAWDEGFAARVRERGGRRIHVKLDTGMGRLGTRSVQQARAVVDAAGDALAGVWTHFATADERGDAFFGEQLAAFTAFAAAARDRAPDVLVHAANSAATLRDPATHFDMVRAGIAVYGMDPFHEDPSDQDLRPVLALRSYVAAVKSAAPGQSAGYGRRFVADRPTALATIPIGYGDGWRRALTNNAEVLIGGARHPLVGTVSMDNVTVELGPGTGVRTGDEAVLIGEQGTERITAEDVARRMKTINYEVTTGLLPRVERVVLAG
jgi:alanine racemase